jgi:phosphopantothenoylcysteine decarboxylase/phosphopantothenate--cysteine ligase
MGRAVDDHSAAADVVIMAAAVADFRPKAPAAKKLRKDDGVPDVLLEPTPDILSDLGRRRREGQTLVGFAAETDSLPERAAGKLRRKGVDLMVANDVSAPRQGFGHDTNRAVIFDALGGSHETSLLDKRALAHVVLDAVLAWRKGPGGRTTEENRSST